jgi:hypothetical protein
MTHDTQREYNVDEALLQAQRNKELEQQKEIDKINAMTHLEMAERYRFAVSGDPYFDNTLPYYKVFNERFKMLGGFTPAISKAIGWGR